MNNAEIERAAIEYVMGLEREARRHPVDVHLQGFPYDISSPPRKIEVKAFGGSARGAPIPSKSGRSRPRKRCACRESHPRLLASRVARPALRRHDHRSCAFGWYSS